MPIDDQTVNDEAVAPFGGVRASGTGSCHGGAAATIEAFTESQWVPLRGDLPTYPFCPARPDPDSRRGGLGQGAGVRGTGWGRMGP